MRQYGVPSLERHAEDHADISAQLTSLIGQPHVGLVSIHPDALLQLIEQWIFVHVPQFDEPLEEFLKASEAA